MANDNILKGSNKAIRRHGWRTVLTFALIGAILFLPSQSVAQDVLDKSTQGLDKEEPARVQTETIVITTTGRGVRSRDVFQPTTAVSGDELQRNLSSSVPAVLEGVPGFSIQYNGPGASSPTIRGMPGDRVLMLEDGHRTGDIYWTASDHGVMVEPISAERIEVVRGPAGLLYGSTAFGGVVNVISDDVPARRPEQVEANVSTHYESVNQGVATGVVLRGPLGPLAFFAEGTARNAQNTQTPLGTLERTDMRVFNGATGLSWTPEWGLLGAGLRYYDNVYGVPGEFGGILIPGGHPGGVSIEARRLSGRVHAAYDLPLGVINSLELKSNFTRYIHDEIEGIVGGEEVLGARFDQLGTDTRLIARHAPWSGQGEGAQKSPRLEGAMGLSFQGRDLSASGLSPGTRSGTEADLGVFGYEELRLDVIRFQVGLRYDYRHVTTKDLSDLRVRTEERRIIKGVGPREFHAISGSVAALLDIAPDWTLGTSVARSTRNPTIEELYSDGPHLADFSFDIGSPDLSSEIGHGVDLFVRGEHPRLEMEAAVYASSINDYIYYNPTGETVRVFREGVSPRVTPVFEAQSDDALFVGAEWRAQWEFIDKFVLDATASYTRATRRAARDPLPFIPPLGGRVELRYEGEIFFGAVGATLAAPQNRVPRPIQIGESLEGPEQPTDGYALANALVGWRFDHLSYGHTVMLQVRNMANTVARDHLSRIKAVAPQPGRNIQLSYRAYF